jgi:hypothetical protein
MNTSEISRLAPDAMTVRSCAAVWSFNLADAIIRALRRVSHIPRRIVRELLMLIQLVWLSLVNRYGRAPVTHPGGPVVSLTTFGKRSHTVHLAIESIARGRALPSKMILWIDDEALFRNLPAAIRRLQKRGLEVQFCKNYGPYNKYYPYVESQAAFDVPLVTADDDVLYPRYWLKKLVGASREYPETVNCYSARVIAVNENGIGKYREYKPCDCTQPRSRHLALGVMGVIYPPSFLMVLKRAGTSFIVCCPRSDDLWLHVQALRSGYKVRQIVPRSPYFSFQGIPGTQQIALSYENVTYGDGNDRQMNATYNDADNQLLRMDCTA